MIYLSAREALEKTIREVPNFPQQGILFQDITPTLHDSEATKTIIDEFTRYYADKAITAIAGIDSRGFIFGSMVALQMSLPLVLIRKKGKLPASTYSHEYDLEYGTDILQIHKDALEKNDRVVIIDDLLATGGTALAACELVEQTGACVAGLGFVIELNDLQGREKLCGYTVLSLLQR